PPQHVLGLARPLVPDEVFELALVEAAAEVAAEPALLARVAYDLLGERPVPAEHAREPDLRQARMAPAVIEEQPPKAPSVQIPAREGLGVRPCGLARKTPGELFHRLLGELSIGGGLAAEGELPLVGNHEYHASIGVLQNEGVALLVDARHDDVAALHQAHGRGKPDLERLVEHLPHPGPGGVHDRARAHRAAAAPAV